jgi:DNA-binding transcriptional LysR family regulator
MYSWSDLRVFLYVHREGTLSKAARRLKVDATTVGRRVQALESDLGLPLFVRGADGFVLTAAGARILPAAEAAERAAHDVERLAAEPDEEPHGRVRLTTIDTLAERVVAPMIPALRARWPGIRLDVLCTNVNLDLVRGEADLALRVGRPAEGSLVSRRVASASERPYVARSLLDARNLDPHDVTDLAALDALVLFSDEGWATERGGHLALRTSSVSMLVNAAVAGAGVAVLPDVIGCRARGLVALDGLGIVRERPLWLVVHRDLRHVSRVRVVADFVAETLRDVPFAGVRPPPGPDGAARG